MIIFTLQTNEYGTEVLIKVLDGQIRMKIFNLTADNEFDYPWEPLNINTLDNYGIKLGDVFSRIEEDYYAESV